MIPLSDLLPGQGAYVTRINGRCDHVHRLQEFGLHSGVRVQMFRPGNTCIVRLAGSKVCLRLGELLNVLVEPDSLIDRDVIDP